MKKLLAVLVALSLMIMAVPALAADPDGTSGTPADGALNGTTKTATITVTPDVTITTTKDSALAVTISWTATAPKYIMDISEDDELILTLDTTSGNNTTGTIPFTATNTSTAGITTGGTDKVYWDGTVYVTSALKEGTNTTEKTSLSYANIKVTLDDVISAGIPNKENAGDKANAPTAATLTYAVDQTADLDDVDNETNFTTAQTAAKAALKAVVSFTISATAPEEEA